MATTSSRPQISARAEEFVDEKAALGDAPEAREPLVLTLGEITALVGLIFVATLATWSLALAQLGRHDGWVALGLAVLTTLAFVGVSLAVDIRPRARLDRAELALLVAAVAAGVFFFFPGFHYAWSDKDPGVYVIHGFAIARDGEVYVDDRVEQAGIPFSQAGRFPGLWNDAEHPGQVTSQFFHLYSAMLATAHDIGGSRALFNLNPGLAVGSVCLIVLGCRRVAGTLVAGLAGALLVTSMMQVWQAKYPSTEISAQLFAAGALLAAVLAMRCRWTSAAFAAGALLGVGFLTRPDGFLYVLVGAGIAALVIAADRVDRRVISFLGGLALTVPYALWNAYEARPVYSAATGIPGAAALVGVMLAVIAAGLAVRAVRRHWSDAGWTHIEEAIDRWQRPLGITLGVLVGVALVLLFFRPEIWGEQYHYSIFSQDVRRSYNEYSARWLSWMITLRGLLLMWIGFCVVMLRRWQAALWVFTVPSVMLLLVYLYDARVSMRLMWWVRRFVPAILPVVVLLIAIALAWAITRRSMVLKALGVLIFASLVVEYARMSLPLRSHDEMAGSWDISAAIAGTAGDEDGVFLFPSGASTYSIGRDAPGSIWWVFDHAAARLPADYDLSTIEQYGRAFPDDPVFVVVEGEDLPDQLPANRFSRAREVVGEIVVWEERQDRRPSEPVVIPQGAMVWELERGT